MECWNFSIQVWEPPSSSSGLLPAIECRVHLSTLTALSKNILGGQKKNSTQKELLSEAKSGRCHNSAVKFLPITGATNDSYTHPPWKGFLLACRMVLLSSLQDLIYSTSFHFTKTPKSGLIPYRFTIQHFLQSCVYVSAWPLPAAITSSQTGKRKLRN